MERVPDQEAEGRLFVIPLDSPDIDVIKQIREEGGADEKKHMPYLKTSIHRVL